MPGKPACLDSHLVNAAIDMAAVVIGRNEGEWLEPSLRSAEAAGLPLVHVFHNAEARFFTMNLPKLLEALDSAGVENPIVSANVNKAGFRMNGGIEGYRAAAVKYPARVIAMSVLTSGGIRPRGDRVGDQRALFRIDRVRHFEPREHRQHGPTDPRIRRLTATAD